VKKVLVTGGTGFVGSHLTELLLKNGYSVVCLVRDPKNRRWLSGLNVETMTGDCLLPDTLPRAVRDVSLVVHAAGLTKAKRAGEYYEVNQVGTRNIVEACLRHNPGLEQLVFISSQAAAGPSLDGNPVTAQDVPHPVSDYGKSKLFAEQEVLKYKDRLPVVILRPSAVYGPRDRDMFEFFRWAARGLTLEIRGEERLLNFCYVGDLAQAISLCLVKRPVSGSIYFVAENRPYSWSEFRDSLLTTGNVKAVTIKIPKMAAYVIGLLSELGSLFSSRPALTNRQKVREAMQHYWTCDLVVIEKELGFKSAFPLQQGLSSTWRWYRDNNWL